MTELMIKLYTREEAREEFTDAEGRAVVAEVERLIDAGNPRVFEWVEEGYAGAQELVYRLHIHNFDTSWWLARIENSGDLPREQLEQTKKSVELMVPMIWGKT